MAETLYKIIIGYYDLIKAKSPEESYKSLMRKIEGELRETPEFKQKLLDGGNKKVLLTEHAIDKCIENPFKLKDIPQDLALILSGLNKDLEGNRDHEIMGELLRRCHAIKSSMLYSADGNGEQNYNRDVGYVSNKYEKVHYLLNEYGIKALKRNDGAFLYVLESIYNAEKLVSDTLCDPSVIQIIPQLSYVSEREIGDVIKNKGYSANPYLLSMISQILKQRVSIITGGAGTGKTGIVEIIYEICNKASVNAYICSFTGKSIANITGRMACSTASTIHSLIVRVDKDMPKCVMLVIEECSMVSTSLISTLFKKLRSNSIRFQLLIVGDRNQLPPIEWGMFFLSLITSKRFPVHELTHNYRSGEVIIRNAEIFKQESRDTDIRSLILTENFSKMTPSGALDFYKNLTSDQYIVITPWIKERNAINSFVQELLHKTENPILKIKFQKWYKGDRIIFNENFHELGIYNGTEALVKGLRAMAIPFFEGNDRYIYYSRDDRSYPYSKDRLFSHLIVSLKGETSKEICVPIMFKKNSSLKEEDKRDSESPFPTIENLELSYALTTHKSQGSEWRNVYYKADTYPSRYIPGGRANLYTAITRSKEKFYFTTNDTCNNMKLIPPTNDQLAYMLME